MSSVAAGPLAGRRILVTRRPEQSSTLRRRLAEAGAIVLETPLIEIAPPEEPGPMDRALSSLADYDWILFTSGNAAQAVRSRLEELGLPPRLPAALNVGSVGPATSAAVRSAFGDVRIAAEPETDYRAEALLSALASDLAGQRILLPLSDRARDVLRDGLERRGALVEAVVAYQTRAPAGAGIRLQALLREGVDVVLLASPSAVEGLVDAAPGVPVPVAVIGPVTAASARQAGLDVVAVASPATTDGLISALVEYFSPP